MKPLNLILFFALLSTYTHVAQVGIGTTTPNASLEIQASNVASPANTDGLLIPKVDEFPTTNPAAAQDGMLVYATGNGSVTKGFYFWNNGSSNWDVVSGSSIQQINDLTDGVSDNDGTNDGSSIFLGVDSGSNDDGTNNQNVGIGFNAIQLNTSGFANSAFGYSSLQNNSTGSRNTGLGYRALWSQTTGSDNTAIGSSALRSNTTATGNTAIGRQSMYFNTTGTANTAVGIESLRQNSTGIFNTTIGAYSLTSNTTGEANAVLGFRAMNDNTTGFRNTAIGYYALANNTNGRRNTAIGNQALETNTTGYYNTAMGNQTLFSNTTGLSNTAIGNNSLLENTTGSGNLALGYNAGRATVGDNNVFVGYETGSNGDDTKSGSVFIGYQAGYDEGNSNRLYIENSSSTTPLIYGEFENDFLRINGDAEVEKSTDAGLAVVTPFGFESSLKLFERGTSGDFGFEFEYDGSPDKFYLWSRGFSGNEGIRMTWLKDGRVGIGTTSPYAKLDLEASNAASPSTTDGFLVPRIDAFPSTNPGSNQTGMLVFLNTDNSFYYWDNSTTSWVNIISSATEVEEVNDLADGRSNSSGSSIFIGETAGQNDDGTVNSNTGMGYWSLRNNTSGAYNSAFGSLSLSSNIDGVSNSAFGRRALENNLSGSSNSAVGHYSLHQNTSGTNNTALGYGALQNNTTTSNNTALGYGASGSTTSYTNTTALGYNAQPNTSNQVRLGNASIAIIGGNANWSVFSDGRVKTNIREDIVGLEFIKRLRPVSYNYDMDAIARFEKTPDSLRLRNAEGLKAAEVQTGFIAQEVEAAAQATGFDFHGVITPQQPDQPYALRYSEFVVPIVKAVQEQQAIIDEQAAEIEALRREIQQIKLLLKND